MEPDVTHPRPGAPASPLLPAGLLLFLVLEPRLLTVVDMLQCLFVDQEVVL